MSNRLRAVRVTRLLLLWVTLAMTLAVALMLTVPPQVLARGGSVPPSDTVGRRVRIADAGSLPGALNVFWLNGNRLHTVNYDRYLVAWKSGTEEFQTDLDGDRVKVVMGRSSDRVILEGLTNGTEYTVRVTHANSVGPAVTHSREATATPAPRERELVSSFSQSPGIAKPELFSMRSPGFLFGVVQFTTGPATSTLGSVTFLRFKPLRVGNHPRNLRVELHLHEHDDNEAGALIGTFVSPPEFVDGPAKFVAPGDGFALATSTSYWLKLALIEGEMHTYVTRHGEEDRTGQPGWLLLDDCRVSSIDVWPYSRSCTTETSLSHGPFVMSLNSPIESTLPRASITGSSAVEGNNVEFTVELSSPTSATATVQYSTVDGSGDLPAKTSDSDYTAVSGGTITFAAGETSKTISIATGDDSTDEKNERFLVRLSSPSANIALSELDTAAGVIINNDQTTSSDSTLAGLTLTDGDGNTITLNETFDRYRFVYTADAGGSVDSLTLTPSFHSGVNPGNLRYFDAIASVRKGRNSADFTRIAPGLNELRLLVTSNNGGQQSLYRIMVTKTASSDATISDLILEDDDFTAIDLSPAFSPSVTEYTATTTGPAPFYVEVGLNHGGADAEVSVNGNVVIPYSFSYPVDTFEMPAGQNTFVIEVTAEDGTVQTYTFTLTRVIPLEVKFGDGPFSVDEGDSLSVPVILNKAAPLTLTIPLTATNLAQADADDYSIPTSVEFLAGESEKSAVFSATADSVTDSGEQVRLGFGTLPIGVSSVNPKWATVDINDTTIVGTAPETPNRPTGTAVFVGGVDLEWNDVPGADSYDVQLYQSGGWTDLPGNGIEIAFYGAGAIISGLDPTATLWFQVRARNAHGASDWSAYRQLPSTTQSEQGRQPRPDSVQASGAPIISGTAQVSETLTADTTGIQDDNGLDRVQYRFQWLSNDGSTDTNIAGATDSTYTLVAADEGNTVSVRVSFTDRGGYAESLTSTSTEEVTASSQGDPVPTPEPTPNSPATGAPAITGAAQVGETLTADTSGISDTDGLSGATFGYQWISNDGTSDTNITGATSSTYTLVAADEGRYIKVKVSFTDDAGFGESLTSAATAAVDAAPPTPEPTPDLPEGTVTGLTVSSDAPGSLTIEWDTPSPSPSDYRINWAQAGQGWLSWRFPNEASRGNEYPDGDTNSLTLTGLTEGAEFRVKMRARYMTGQYANDRWSGPWTDTVTQQVLEQPIQATSTSTTTRDIDAPTGLTASLQGSANSLGGGNSEGMGTKGFSDGVGTKSLWDGIGTRNTETLATTSMYVMLSWTNPTGGVQPTGYQVKRWITDSHPTFFDCDLSSTTSSCYSSEEYRDSQLTADVTFNYAVRLVKRADGEDPRWSLWSDTVTIEIPAGLTADSYPAAPEGLTAVEVLHETDPAKVSITWDPVTSTGTTTYTIYRTDLKSATPTVDTIATTTATSYDDEDIDPYRSYQYRIQAVNSLGLGSPLSKLRIVNTSGLQYGVPDRPTALSATTTDISATTTVDLGTATSSDTLITLSWTPAATGTTTTYSLIYAGVVTEEEYRAIERLEDAVITVRARRITSSTSTTFAVASGSLYAFGVKACNDNGCSSLSRGYTVNLIGELDADPNAPGQPIMPDTS